MNHFSDVFWSTYPWRSGPVEKALTVELIDMVSDSLELGSDCDDRADGDVALKRIDMLRGAESNDLRLNYRKSSAKTVYKSGVS